MVGNEFTVIANYFASSGSFCTLACLELFEYFVEQQPTRTILSSFVPSDYKIILFFLLMFYAFIVFSGTIFYFKIQSAFRNLKGKKLFLKGAKKKKSLSLKSSYKLFRLLNTDDNNYKIIDNTGEKNMKRE